MTQAPTEEKFNAAIEYKLLAGILVALVIVVGMAKAAIQNNSRQVESAGWANHSHSFVSETDAILSSLNAAEAMQRTFIVSGDMAVMQAASDRFTKTAEHLAIAQQLAFENPTQIKRLDRVAALLQQQIDWNKESVQLRMRSAAAAAGVFTNVATRTNLASLESEINAAKADENALLLQREQQLHRQAWRTNLVLYSGAALIVILLAYTFYLVRRDSSLRRLAAEALRADKKSLEQTVQIRTAELAATNDKLQIENMEQKWGQAALQRVITHHELILNSIREPILIISRTGKIMSANPAAAELVGLEARQLPGRSLPELIVENEMTSAAPWERHFVSTTLKKGQPLEAKSALVKGPDGKWAPVRVSCYPTRDSENLTGAVITIAQKWVVTTV